MSRSGYTEDYDEQWLANLYRGSVTSAENGQRGQKMFRDLLEALDGMPVKQLIVEELITHNGSVCALGALGRARGIPLFDLDSDNATLVGKTFDIATCLAREVVYQNDENGARGETPEQRFVRIRAWVVSKIKKED